MNLVATMLQFLTPMITNKIASSLGINNAMATTAIGAILPAILAGLAGKAGTPAGASALSTVLGQQDGNLLGSFAGTLGGPGQSALVNAGTAALSSLLGGSATSALAGAVGKFAGANPTQSSSLIGMLAPVVLGQLAQTQKSSGLDAGGLANLLAGQKSNIAAAMPAGFADLLKGSGLLDSIAGNLPRAAPMKPTTMESPKMEVPRMPSMPEAPAFNWMPWAVGAVALLGLFYAFGGNKPAPAPVAVEKAAAPAMAAMDQAKTLIAGLSAQLGNVKDVPTAQAALPQLTGSSTALDTLGKVIGSLSPDAKAQIAALIANAMPQIAPLIATVLKIPGAEAILKPVLDAILGKLTTLSKT